MKLDTTATMPRSDRSRLQAQGVKLRELQDRYDELREAVEDALDAAKEGEDPPMVFAALHKALEHVPAGRWHHAECIAKLHEWVERYGEPPEALNWNPAGMRAKKREHLMGRWLEGDWPSLRTVVRLFGSWNAFVAEAGYAPRTGSDPARRGPGGAGQGIDRFPEWTGWQVVGPYRERAGVSQGKLADMAGISVAYLGYIERGHQTNPSVRMLLAISRALRVPAAVLLDDHE